jgi:magnesium-transporting ATPase (P-type)
MASKASQIPYYIAMTVYLGFNALIYFVQNQTVTGGLSDVYLVASFVCGFMAFASFLYMILEDNGADTLSASVTVLGITLSKMVWYLGVFAAIGVRAYFAYLSNHNATGAESVWGYVWLVSSVILLLMTFPNAKLYFKTKAVAAANQAKLEAMAAAQAKAETK